MTVEGALPVANQAGIPDEFMTLSTELKAPEFDLSKHIDSLSPPYWGPSELTHAGKSRRGEEFYEAKVPQFTINSKHSVKGVYLRSQPDPLTNHVVDAVRSLGIAPDTAFDKWKHWQESVDAGKPYVHCGRKAPYKKVYFYDPQPEDFDIEDIAYSLSRIRRFAGGPALTVLQHSVLMALNASTMEVALQCLIHDAPEMIIGDIPSPVKQCCPEIQRIEARLLQVALQTHCGVSELADEVKELDAAAYHWDCAHIRKDGSHADPMNYAEMITSYTEHDFLALYRRYKEIF